MQFVFKGFDQSGASNTRAFRFESVGANHLRTPIVVSADMTLARSYQIQLQQLPLVCRELLEHSDPETLATGVVVLTELHMARLRNASTLAAEEKKTRRVRPPVSTNVGAAWRTPASRFQ